jgi:hypothetical protein
MSLMKITKSLLLGLALAAWPMACGSSDDGKSADSSCTPNQQDSCTCDSGATGAHVCGEDGTWGECVCTECGNGTVEVGEECDGTPVTATCGSVTMNAMPSGTLACNSNCEYDRSGCTAPSTGGTTSSGGAPSTGGTLGGGGTGTGGTLGAGTGP